MNPVTFNLQLATVALANSADFGEVLALENELALDNDGWALLAPYGEHRKTRHVQRDGAVVAESFVQVFDEAAVDAILANEKGGVINRLKRALIKRPIYNGHPDLKLFAPETVTLGNDKLIPLGVNEDCRKTARGLEFKPLLVPAGAEAIENEGCKFPSGLFLLQKTGTVRENGDIEVRPFKLASIGLTAHPNISGVDSLANAKANQPAAKQTEENKQTEDHMKSLLIGWLAAQGIALGNDATDQAVFDAFNKEWLTKTTSLTALGNDKSTLTQTVNTITTDRDAQKQRADDATTALANANTETAKVRKQFIEARVDLAITQGKAALADRATEITALENSKTLDADLATLDQRAIKFQVASQVQGDRKAGAATAQSASEQIISLANSDPRYKDIKDFATAYKRILADHPALAEAIKQKPAAS